MALSLKSLRIADVHHVNITLKCYFFLYVFNTSTNTQCFVCRFKKGVCMRAQGELRMIYKASLPVGESV